MSRRYPFRPLEAEPGVREFILGDRYVSYTVKRSARARSWRLEFNPRNGLVAVLPRGLDLAEVDGILASKARWIKAQLDQAERRASRSRERRLRDGGPFLFLGREYTLRCAAGNGRAGAVTLNETEVTVNLAPGDEETLRRAVARWLKREARKVITAAVAAEAAATKAAAARVFVRNQRTRWASCSAAGNLNFNYHVAMAPPEIVRYLVVHEVAHLKTLRHGKRFHRLVARRYPDYRAAEKWLRAHEDLLTF